MKNIMWIVIVLVLTTVITNAIIGELGQPWYAIVYGVVGFALYSIKHFFRSVKDAVNDPDVRISSELMMPVYRYRKYKEWYDEYQRLMHEHGTDSKQANDYFYTFFKEIENPNEWRRYEDYRAKLFKEEIRRKMKSYE